MNATRKTARPARKAARKQTASTARKAVRKAPAAKIPRGISPAEWKVRCDLAACYQLIDLYGMSDLTGTHISVRVPGPEHHFLLNPYGWLFDEITASSLIKVDLKGNVVSGPKDKLNFAGFVLHSAIHMAVPELICVMHSHTVANAAVVPKPDIDRGAVVKAYVVITAQAQAERADAPDAQAYDAQLVAQLQSHVKGLLAPYEYPKEIEFIDQLPMTTTGKVQRRVLRLQEEERARLRDPAPT